MTIFDIFSTREIASAIYLFIFIVIGIRDKKVRTSYGKVIRCACKAKMIIPFLLLVAYMGMIVFLFTYTPFWKHIYLKDVVMWLLFIGVPYCYNAASKGEEEKYFVSLFKDNLKLVVLLEFFVGTFTFNLVTELILQFVIGIIVLFQVTSKGKKRFWDGVLGIIGIVIICCTVKAAMGHYVDIKPIDAIVSFCIPIVFSILFIPCAYLLAVYAKYETLYIKWGFKEPKERRVRWKRHLIVFCTCGLSYKKICEFYKVYVQKLHIRMTQEDFEKIIEDFKCSYKKGEISYGN